MSSWNDLITLCSFGGATDFYKDIEEPIPANQVERFSEVDDRNI